MKTSLNIKYSLAGAVSLATFIVYIAALNNGFIDEWDDGLYVTENPYIRSLDGAFFKWAFFDFYASNWHPLAWISHAVDYAAWGLNPLGHHLTNTVLHSLNTFIVAVLIIRLMVAVRHGTSNTRPSACLSDPAILIAGGVTGLLFGLHPLHVESVAWVSERKDLLCALFFLLSVNAYVAYAASPGAQPAQRDSTTLFYKNRRYLLALASFVLALLSKPMAVSLPFVLLILDWHPFRRIGSREAFKTAVIEKLPFIALSSLSAVITILAQRTTETLISTESIPLTVRVLVAVKSLIAYLWSVPAPLQLLPFYPYPQHVPAFSSANLLSLALVGGMTIACLIVAKRQQLWPAVWGYYCVTLLPVLGIVQVGVQAMADRYMYLPGLGPFFVMGLGAAWIWGKLNAPKRNRFVKVAGISAAIFVLVSMVSLTIEQIGIWQNSVTLWSYVVEKEPEKSFTAYNNLGSALVRTGQYDKAVESLNAAIVLDPKSHLAYVNRGALFEKIGLFGPAIEDLDRAITLNPGYHLSYFNRAVVLGQMNQYTRALEDLNSAIGLNRYFAPAYVARGNVQARGGNTGQAASDFRKACELGDNAGCYALQSLVNMN